MHPILVRIPLPHGPLMLWWALAAVAVFSVVYGVLAQRRGERNVVIGSLVVAVAAGAGAFIWRGSSWQAPNLPLYSYGVMLGISFVVGWFLSLTLAERDGLPRETMANCYILTALGALVVARLLYVVTNFDEFKTARDVLDIRRGGMVAYGGFVGGFLASWLYLYSRKIRLLPWADDAVPSLATGLLVTRIGCYLFGCDFGTRLSDDAPGWLKKLGTFPHWSSGTIDGGGEGAPAFVRHLELFRGTPLGEELTRTNHSLPVHPTQLYESLIGLALFALVMWQRKHLKFRGQVFFLFVFAYGVLRFSLELLRDDVERGSYGPEWGQHILIPGALLLLSLGFIFGISLGITNLRARTIARVVALVPPLVAFIALKPASFGRTTPYQLSTSQWIALITALLVSYFYARYWQEARRNPAFVMSLGEGATAETKRPATPADEGEEDDEEEDDQPIVAKGKRAAKKAAQEDDDAGAEPNAEAT